MTIKTYTSANSPTIQWFEKTYKRKGAKLVVDYGTVLEIKYAGKTKPPARSYEQQIQDWRKGYMWARVQQTKCQPTGWYWVKYKVIKFYEGEPITTEKPPAKPKIPIAAILIPAAVAAFFLVRKK